MIEDKEKIQQLEAFRMEIKRVKEGFPSLFAVEDVGDLRLEELEVWEKYKLLFKETKIILSELDMRKKDILSKLMIELDGLAGLIKEILSVTKNTNQLEFLAWMNNRLVGLNGSLQYDKVDEETLRKSIDRLSEERRSLLF